MNDQSFKYSSSEKVFLWFVSLVGFLVLNAIFLYEIIYSPSTLLAAIQNPISLAFILEAFLMMGVLCYLLTKWKVMALSWKWFVFLSILGSMAFALPLVLLWRRKSAESQD